MKRRELLWFALLAVVGACLIGANFAICPLAGLFGIPCPSCGLTRASAMLLFGDWHRAWLIHPAVFLVLPYLGAIVAVRWLAKSSCATRRLALAGIVLLVAMTLLWVLRFIGYFGGPVPVRPWYS